MTQYSPDIIKNLFGLEEQQDQLDPETRAKIAMVEEWLAIMRSAEEQVRGTSLSPEAFIGQIIAWMQEYIKEHSVPPDEAAYQAYLLEVLSKAPPASPDNH